MLPDPGDDMTLELAIAAGCGYILRERAARARREDFIAFLDQSPAVPPIAGDE